MNRRGRTGVFGVWGGRQFTKTNAVGFTWFQDAWKLDSPQNKRPRQGCGDVASGSIDRHY